MSKLATGEISIFWLVPVAEKTDLSLTVRNPENRFCRAKAHIIPIQCNPFIMHIVITQFWIKHGHGMAPKYFTIEFYKRNYKKMTIKFSCNSFCKIAS